jgi:hypothetical protein
MHIFPFQQVELSAALDAAGQVYVFGTGPVQQFASDVKDFGSKTQAGFTRFRDVVDIWKKRVQPEFNSYVDLTAVTRRTEHDEFRPRTMEAMLRGHTADPQGRGGSNAAARIKDRKSKNIKKKEGALKEREMMLLSVAYPSKFYDVSCNTNTVALWGKNIFHVGFTSNNLMALSAQGEIFAWGGMDHWWDEIEVSSERVGLWRGYTTDRSKLLLMTDKMKHASEMDHQLDKPQIEDGQQVDRDLILYPLPHAYIFCDDVTCSVLYFPMCSSC